MAPSMLSALSRMRDQSLDPGLSIQYGGMAALSLVFLVPTRFQDNSDCDVC